LKIVFTGDVFLGGDLQQFPRKEIIHSTCFHNADFRVINLEQAVSNSETVLDKCTLYTGTNALKRLQNLKVNAVNLANNHIQDKGEEGIYETLEHLQQCRISAFGAGRNLDEATRPVWITPDTALMAFCEFGRTYLKQIHLAGVNNAGVAPLRHEVIKEALDRNISPGKKVILVFHWGREHVWLPPYQNIKLARILLEDGRVLMIIGMHAHRIQGVVNHAGKVAYMCLGNCLFPNFYIKPPTQIYYPECVPANVMITRQYHSVSRITYKKWRFVNRISLLIEFDSDTGKSQMIPFIQEDEIPEVSELKGFKRFAVQSWIFCLSLVYRLPSLVYIPLESAVAKIQGTIWRFQILRFRVRQDGVKWFCRKIKSRLSKE